MQHQPPLLPAAAQAPLPVSPPSATGPVASSKEKSPHAKTIKKMLVLVDGKLAPVGDSGQPTPPKYSGGARRRRTPPPQAVTRRMPSQARGAAHACTMGMPMPIPPLPPHRPLTPPGGRAAPYTFKPGEEPPMPPSVAPWGEGRWAQYLRVRCPRRLCPRTGNRNASGPHQRCRGRLQRPTKTRTAPEDMPPPPLPRCCLVSCQQSPAQPGAAPKLAPEFVPAASSSALKAHATLSAAQRVEYRHQAPRFAFEPMSSYHGDGDEEHDDCKPKRKSSGPNRRLSSCRILDRAHSFCEESHRGSSGKPEIGRRVSFAPDVPENTGMKKKQLSRTRSEIQRIFAQNLEAGKVRKALSSGDDERHQDEAKPLRLNLPTSVPPAASSDPQDAFTAKVACFSPKGHIQLHCEEYTRQPDPRAHLRERSRDDAERQLHVSGCCRRIRPLRTRRSGFHPASSLFLRERRAEVHSTQNSSVEKAKTLLRRQTSGGTAVFPAES